MPVNGIIPPVGTFTVYPELFVEMLNLRGAYPAEANGRAAKRVSLYFKQDGELPVVLAASLGTAAKRRAKQATYIRIARYKTSTSTLNRAGKPISKLLDQRGSASIRWRRRGPRNRLLRERHP